MKMFKKMKKGFTIIELIFVIVLISVLSMGAFVLLNKESSKAMTDNQINSATRTLMTALSEYKVKSANAKYNYLGVNGTTLKPFLDTTNTFTVNSITHEISLIQNNNIKISVAPVQNSAPADSVQMYFDVSGLTAQGYSADQLLAIENSIARIFTDAYPNAKILGATATSTPVATVPVAGTAINSDGKLLVVGIQ